MPPQDTQTPASTPVPPPSAGGVDLSAQIPPTYASPMQTGQPLGAPAQGSALQDALYAQLTSGPPPDVATTPPPQAPASPAVDPLASHLQAEDPDPMAGFTDPALQQASNSHLAPDVPLANAQPAAGVAASSVDAFVSAEPSQPAMPTSDFTNPVSNPAQVSAPPAAVPAIPPVVEASVEPPVGPVPAAAQAYDPAQDVGTGSVASAYPAAPEPLPMPTNPLELDGTAQAPAPVEVGPDPAVASVPGYVPTPTDAQSPPQIDLVTGLPIDQPPQPLPVTAAPLQNMLDDSSQAALDPLDPYADPLLMSEGSTESSDSGGKSLLFSIGVGVAVLVFGVIVLALILGKKPITEVSVDTLAGGDSNKQATITPTITAPDGYVAIAKECYEFAIPTDNNVSTTDNNCRIDAAFGAEGVSTIAIVPLTDSFDSLDKAVAAAKKDANITASNLTAERDIKLGDSDAKEIVYNAGTKAAPQSKTLIVTTVSDGKHKQDNDVITGYSISMSSSDSFSQAAVSTLEASWSWR